MLCMFGCMFGCIHSSVIWNAPKSVMGDPQAGKPHTEPLRPCCVPDRYRYGPPFMLLGLTNRKVWTYIGFIYCVPRRTEHASNPHLNADTRN